MLEKLDHTHSKLQYIIEELEKRFDHFSKLLDHDSEQLEHRSKRLDHHSKEHEHHSEQLEHHSVQLDHHSKQHDHHSKQLDHLSKEGEHQMKRLRRYSEELVCLNKNARAEDEEKETYSEFSDKKGINLCRLKHEIFMQIFMRRLVCKRYKKSNSVCVHTRGPSGAKLLGGGGGVCHFLSKNSCEKCSHSPMNVFVSRSGKFLETPCSSQF